VVRFIHCLAVLVPTLNFSPDAEGATLAIEAIGSLIPNAKVSSSQLRQEGERIKTQLSELGKLQYRLVKNNRPEDLMCEDKEQNIQIIKFPAWFIQCRIS
jgi:predicted ATP-grasp superfamily ATP-dependent carboligase